MNCPVSENLKIEIRPIPNRNNIREFASGLELVSGSHTIPPLVNGVTRKYETGLSKDDIEYIKSTGFREDIDDNYSQGIRHSFWESNQVKVSLENGPIFLHPGKNILDFIKYRFLLKSRYIYNSEEDLKRGGKPQATHYIYNQEEELLIKASKLEKKNKLINDISGLSLKRKKDILMIILDESTENKSENYLTVKFDEIINSKELSIELEELLKSDVNDVTLSAVIKSAIHKAVIKKTKQGFFYQETNLGFSEKELLTYFKSPENQEILLSIKSKIQ